MEFLNLSNNNESKYQQIYEGIKEKVLKGNLRANEKLPSKRQLANELKVSINTIANAYEQLLSEGYIYAIERKGYFVESGTEFSNRGVALENKLPADLREDDTERENWLTLSHMSADISLFPFKEWMKCQNKAIVNHKKELSELGHPQGPYMTRKTICRMIALSRGVVCEPEQIVIGAGSELLIQQFMGIQNRKQVIGVENPGYSRFYRLLNNLGFYVKPIQLDDKGIDIQEVVSSKANYVFVTPSHQFPTGTIMPISRRIELLNWAVEEENRYIVEDDYDSEFKYETNSIPSLQSLDHNNRVIYMGTLSKTLLPGIRISYMILPPDILRKYRNQYSDLMQFSNLLGLLTLHYFIDKGSYSRHIKRMNHHYEMKRRLLIDQLRAKFKREIYIEDIPAGLHFLARFKSDKTYEEVEIKAKEEKLEVYTIRRFLLKEKDAKSNWIDLVIGFANIQESEIPKAVDRLYRVLDDRNAIP